MGQKSRALGNGVAHGSLEKRKKDKTGLVLDGLVSDLARRAQSAIDGSGPTQHLESIRAIHRLLGQIQKLERPFVNQPNVPDVSARLKVLGDWLQQRGVPIVGLQLEGGLPEGAGVVAKQAFDKGQRLCTVPAHVMMTTATAIRSRDDVGILFKADPILRQMPTLILVLHLLFEKHRPPEELSNWAGYIASLPGQGLPSDTSSDNAENFIMPLAFSLETIEALKGTAVLVEMHKAVRNYARQYAHVRLLLKQLRQQSLAIERANAWFTWAEFRWAASIIMTRQNPIPGTPDMEMGQALALIPYLDMFNHEVVLDLKEGDITCHFAVEPQQMELTAKRNYEAGEQVYISYGNRPNSALLLYSGFVPNNNSKDRMKIPVELPPSDPLYSRKAALLKWLELPSSGWLELFNDGTPSPELATWVKVAIMRDSSIVTENLRAAIASAIASHAQVTAALREAEEKARNVGLLQVEQANGGTVDEEFQSSTELECENGAPKVEDHSTIVKGISNGTVENTSCEDSYPDQGSAVDEEVLVPGQVPSTFVESQESGATVASIATAEDGNASPTMDIHDASEVRDIETSLDGQDIVSDEHEQILGEQLFPAEAALLGEICRIRISEFGGDIGKGLSGMSQALPQGLGVGLSGGFKTVQLKNSSSEFLMAMKIRQQEQATLLRAIDRGVRYQHIHSQDCHHCH